MVVSGSALGWLLLLLLLIAGKGFLSSRSSLSRASSLISGVQALHSSPLFHSDTEADFEELMADLLAAQSDPANAEARGVPYPEQLRQLKQSQTDRLPDGIDDSLSKFYASAKAGIQALVQHDLPGAVGHFDVAAQQNSSQPLVQRGIALYLLGRYEEAARQLQKDIARLEHKKLYRAADMRLWLSASLNRLGRTDEARKCLGLGDVADDGSRVVESRFLLQIVLAFYAGDVDLTDILAVIGRVDEADFTGTIFYGNFYLG